MLKRKYNRASLRIAKRRKARGIFGLSLKIGLPVVFFVGFVFILRADFLQVKNFEILGAETIPSESIKNIASDFISGAKFFLIPKSNILLLDKEKLSAALLSKFGRLEKVEINKQFFSKNIELKILERKADFLWCSPKDECFFMTKDGFVFDLSSKVLHNGKLDGLDGANKLIFRGILEENPLMKNFATPAEMQNYLKLVEVLKNVGFEISSINIESSNRAVAKSDTGDIIFSPEETDLSIVAQNIILLIDKVKSENSSAKFQYIDTRFGNKMFYKLY